MTQKVISERKLANVQKQAQEWTAGFVASNQYANLSAKEQKYAEVVTVAFSEWMYRAELRGGREWTAASMETVLLNTFPVEVSEYAEFVTELSVILTAYFNYLDESDTIKNAKALLRRLETLVIGKTATEIEPKAEAVQTEVTKKVVKKTTKSTAKATVTPEYTNAEIVRFNRFAMGNSINQQTVTPAVVAEPIFEGVGRNEPCPCGSGKKFKKCHG